MRSRWSRIALFLALAATLMQWGSGCKEFVEATPPARKIRFQTRVFFPPLAGAPAPSIPIPSKGCESQGTFAWTVVPGDNLISQGDAHSVTGTTVFQAVVGDQLVDPIITTPGGCRYESLTGASVGSGGLQPGEWRFSALQFDAQQGILWSTSCDVTLGEDFEDGTASEAWVGFTFGAQGCEFLDLQSEPEAGAVLFPDCPPEVCSAAP